MTTPFAQPQYAALRLLLALLKWMREAPLRHLSMLSPHIPPDFKGPDTLASALENVLEEPFLQLDLPDSLLEDLSEHLQEKGIQVVLDECITTLEQHQFPEPDAPFPLADNLNHLQQALNLTQVELDLLALCILINTHDLPYTLAQKINHEVIGASGGFMHPLALVLGQPLEVVQQVLGRKSILLHSGLIKLELEQHTIHKDLVDILDLLPGLEQLTHEVFEDTQSLMGIWFKQLTPSTLTQANFPHLAETIEEVRLYLQQHRTQRTPGINVLLYGQPGTGKTELANLLSHSTGLVPYGVKTSLTDLPTVAPRSRNGQNRDRFQAYRLGQHLLKSQPNAVLIFDEAEDVFAQGTQGLLGLLMPRPTHSDGRKAWINEQLETNPVPTFWLTNHVQQIDPAYMRRYDFLIEVPVPPKSVRKRIIQRHWAEFDLPESLIEALATYADIPPAIYAKAAKVVKALNTQGQACQNALLRQINDWRRVHNLPPVQLASAAFSLPYDIDLINAEPSAAFILKMLQRTPHAKLCFYGSPGTGKTAFAHHLAEQLNQPLMQRRVSDVISPYVGETEKNLAQLFREAEREQAVLFLDEGDSFLRDRTLAHHSWEVTQTNELLTQMEHFQGIFILATNLMDNLDPAAMRRFDFHVHFKPLTDAQKWQLFKTLVPDATTRHREKLEPLPLIHGHFATVQRQIKLADIKPDGDFVVQLLKTQSQG